MISKAQLKKLSTNQIYHQNFYFPMESSYFLKKNKNNSINNQNCIDQISGRAKTFVLLAFYHFLPYKIIMDVKIYFDIDALTYLCFLFDY